MDRKSPPIPIKIVLTMPIIVSFEVRQPKPHRMIDSISSSNRKKNHLIIFTYSGIIELYLDFLPLIGLEFSKGHNSTKNEYIGKSKKRLIFCWKMPFNFVMQASFYVRFCPHGPLSPPSNWGNPKLSQNDRFYFPIKSKKKVIQLFWSIRELLSFSHGLFFNFWKAITWWHALARSTDQLISSLCRCSKTLTCTNEFVLVVHISGKNLFSIFSRPLELQRILNLCILNEWSHGVHLVDMVCSCHEKKITQLSIHIYTGCGIELGKRE